MREIKFRGLDKTRKEWVYGYYYAFGDNHYIIEPGKPGIPDQYIEVIPESVGQWTGLVDKNGREIFEGDILQSEYTNFGDEGPRCHPVVWRNGCWDFDHNITGCCKPWRSNLHGHRNSEIVIGDVFTTPHLLDNKKEV